jgi:group I intron endonuclease
MTSGIYQFRNIFNGRLYIGQSKNIEKRRAAHKYAYSTSMPITRAIKKYGWENFEFKILILVDNQEDLDLYETKIIKLYDTRAPNGYNLKLGGGVGMHHSDTIEKIRLTKTGTVMSEKARQNMSEAGRNRVHKKGYKCKLSEQGLRRKSEALKGNTHTLGFKHSAESIEKMKIASMGRKISIETIQKRIETRKRNKLLKEQSK